MPPTLCTITGTILDAAGNGVPNVQVLLRPAPADPATGIAKGGLGVVLNPVEVLTDTDGDFAITAVAGLRFQLVIDAIGLSETFVAPTGTIRFDLLGLTPEVGQAKSYTDGDDVEHVVLTLIVPRLATVLQRFQRIVVQKAASQSGPWTEAGTVELVAGTDTYQFNDDDDPLSDGYYRAFYENDEADVSDYSDPKLGTSFAEALVLSISELKQVYLFGIDLTGDDGTPYPDLMYEVYIQAATAWMEHELGISIVARDIVGEQHDHYAADYGNWGYLQLYSYPVLSVDLVEFQYPSMESGVEIDNRWIVASEDMKARGVIQIVPGQGNIADVLLIPGALMPMFSTTLGRVPGVWRVSYRAGWEVPDIPRDVRHVIGMMASLGVMNVAGDLVGGSGLQGWSVSIPGLSQNVTTTNSSTNAGFGARIIEYTKEIKTLLPALKRNFASPAKMAVA